MGGIQNLSFLNFKILIEKIILDYFPLMKYIYRESYEIDDFEMNEIIIIDLLLINYTVNIERCLDIYNYVESFVPKMAIELFYDTINVEELIYNYDNYEE